jgi:hypothetical protein
MKLEAATWVDGARVLARIEGALPPEIVIHARHDEAAAAVAAVAAAQLRRHRGVAEELRALPGLLQEGERVARLALAGGVRWPSLVVLTDRRLMWLWGSDLDWDAPLARITGLTLRRGARGSRLIIRVAGGRERRIDRLRPRRRARDIAAGLA